MVSVEEELPFGGYEKDYLPNAVFDSQVKIEFQDTKFDSALSRAKSKVMEYALCNDFEWFCTLTLSPRMYDRGDLDKFKKDLGQFIRDERKKGYEIEYLFVPEPHKDGAWHMHGFFKGIPFQYFKQFALQDKIPKKLKDKINNGDEIYNFPKYVERFGWCVFEKIRDRSAAARYMVKYITKGLANITKGKHLYCPSRGLKTSELVYQGYDYFLLNCDYPYENMWMKIGMYDEKIFKNFIQPHIDKLKDVVL